MSLVRESTVSRIYAEPIDVWLADGRPARFVWRGRMYRVRQVLEHWITTREWWKRSGAGPGEPTEREFWRVEAGSGRAVGVYELRFDAATGQWLLARVWD